MQKQRSESQAMKTKMNEVQATWLTPTDPLMKGGGGREERREIKKEKLGQGKDRQADRQRQRILLNNCYL